MGIGNRPGRQSKGRHQGQCGESLRDDSTHLATTRHPAGGAASLPDGKILSGVGHENRDHGAGTDDQERDGDQRIGKELQCFVIPQERGQQSHGGDSDGHNEHPLGAPKAVQIGRDRNGRNRDQCGPRNEGAGEAHAAAFGDQAGRKPQHHAKIYKAPGQRRERKRDGQAQSRTETWPASRTVPSSRAAAGELVVITAPYRASVWRASSIRPISIK